MLVSAREVHEARDRIASTIVPTPCVTTHNLSQRIGRTLVLKPEHRQRTGSFKVRGATSFVARLPPGTERVVAASAGNHAQGVALAAAQHGLRALIYMPERTPLPKVDATRHYGAEVRLQGVSVDDCISAAQADVTRRGGVCVPPFDHPDVIAGQGTVGLEIAEEAPDAEVVVVPVGGGGLIAGVATALAKLRPGVRVVGVEAEAMASMRASLDARAVSTVEPATTMADGIAVAAPSELTLAHVQAYVDDVVTVTEEEISQSVVLLLERAKAVVEPAGAVGLAAVLAGKVGGGGEVVCVLSGGNVDPLLLTKLIDHGLSAAGRYLLLSILVPDEPGSLARLLAVIADRGLNVLSVEHQRSGLDLPVDTVEVRLTLETRDPEHREQVVADLRSAGYDPTLA